LGSICIPRIKHGCDLFVGLAEDDLEAMESVDAAGERLHEGCAQGTPTRRSG
jgi:hypothetical protein